MTDRTSYIRLPSALSNPALIVLPESLDDDKFSAHQIEFVERIFGYCAFLGTAGRETPVSDAFLAVFVNLLDVMEANAPEDARRCVNQLRGILKAVFPESDIVIQPSAT
jgi:hypothetical protein